MQEIYEKARQVRIAVFDVDGVMTDGRLFLTDGGEEIKSFCAVDGHGMKMLRESGVELAIVTGRTSRCVALRAQNLGITLLFQGIADKARAFAELLAAQRIPAHAAAYMGDDLVDLPVLRQSGLALTVPDAPLAVRQYAHYITRARGGDGAVREACELIMQAQGTLAGRLAESLR
jgi:3-deoxy-D-manno-octulosonate 8-phosphate phosphatase (KDO 8-P phosphatase)